MAREEIRPILEKYRTIAVVGLSRDPTKDSYRVAEYLKSKNYRIIPVNPVADEILGEKCYRSLLEIPDGVRKTVEIVNIFRPAEDVPPIVDQAIELRGNTGNPRVIWMQLGITNETAAKRAEDAGFDVVMDRCMMIERRNLER